MKVMTGLLAMLMWGSASASYVSLDTCDFIIPSGYFVSSGSINGSEITLVPVSKTNLGTIRIQQADGPPEDMEGEWFSLEVIGSTYFSSHSVYEVKYHLSGQDEPMGYLFVMVGQYRIQIPSELKGWWQDFLINCSD